MSDTSTTTIKATFETREAADLAVEHLVQKHAIARTDIFVKADGFRNSSGVSISGGDASHANGPRDDAQLGGEIEVSVDVAAAQFAAVQSSFGDAGANWVSGK